MFRLNPNNKFNIPSGDLSKLFKTDNLIRLDKPIEQVPKIQNQKSDEFIRKEIEREKQLNEIEEKNNEEITIIENNNEMEKIDKINEIKINEEFARKEFERIVREKLDKLDNVLLSLKEKQDGISEIKLESKNLPPKVIESNLLNVGQTIPNIIQNVPNQLNVGQIIPKRTKRSYYPITDNMWNDVQVKFPDIPLDIKQKIYSDGLDYFVDTKNKKSLLNNKIILKLLNKKT